MSRLKGLLRENWRTAAAIVAIELLIAVVPSAAAGGDQPYLGGYFTNTVRYDTEHVFMECRIPPGGTIPSGNWLIGVLSVAGVKDGSLSGWVYQVGIGRTDNGQLRWTAQSWDMNQMYSSRSAPLPDAGNWAGIYLRMDPSSDYTYRARCWGYKNDLDHLSYYDQGYIWWNYGEDCFRVGTTSYSGHTFKHFQFGVESHNPITNYNWDCFEYQLGYYYNGLWRYQPAKVCWQGDSDVTWRGDDAVHIGEINYAGVDKYYSYSGRVAWYYNGVRTIPNGSWLWSTSGSWNTYPPAVFQMP